MLSLVMSLVSMLVQLSPSEPKKPEEVKVVRSSSFYAEPGQLSAKCESEGLDWKDLSMEVISTGGKGTLIVSKGHELSGRLQDFSMLFSDDAHPVALKTKFPPRRLPETAKGFFSGAEFNVGMLSVGLPQLVSMAPSKMAEADSSSAIGVLGFGQSFPGMVMTSSLSKDAEQDGKSSFRLSAAGLLNSGAKFAFSCSGIYGKAALPLDGDFPLDGFVSYTSRETGASRSRSLDGMKLGAWMN